MMDRAEKMAKIIDAAMAKHGIPNDAQLAKRLGVDRSQVNRWRRGEVSHSMVALLQLVADHIRGAEEHPVAQSGERLHLRIPPATAEHLGLKPGEYVEVRVRNIKHDPETGPQHVSCHRFEG